MRSLTSNREIFCPSAFAHNSAFAEKKKPKQRRPAKLLWCYPCTVLCSCGMRPFLLPFPFPPRKKCLEFHSSNHAHIHITINVTRLDAQITIHFNHVPLEICGSWSTSISLGDSESCLLFRIVDSLLSPSPFGQLLSPQNADMSADTMLASHRSIF